VPPPACAHSTWSDGKRRPTARRCGDSSRSLVFDLSIAHDSFGSSCHVLQNGNLTHPQDLDGPLRVAAQRKIPRFRFKRAAFYQSLKSKVGLAASKAAALRINLNIEGCGIVAAPVHAPSRAPLLLPLLFTQYPSPPRSLVRVGQTSPRSNKHTHIKARVRHTGCPWHAARAQGWGATPTSREGLVAAVSRHMREVAAAKRGEGRERGRDA
jgi:hypothetical protein